MMLSGLTNIQRQVLYTMKTYKRRTRGEMIKACPNLNPGSISSALNRLEALGFIDAPERMGEKWAINQTGLNLFAADDPDCSEQEGNPAEIETPDGPCQEPTSAHDETIQELDELATRMTEIEREIIDEIDQISPEIMNSMEIEIALDRVRTRLKAPTVPARASRVYREIVAALPAELTVVLSPITALVDAHGG